jgi:hypothetical protein
MAENRVLTQEQCPRPPSPDTRPESQHSASRGILGVNPPGKFLVGGLNLYWVRLGKLYAAWHRSCIQHCGVCLQRPRHLTIDRGRRMIHLTTRADESGAHTICPTPECLQRSGFVQTPGKAAMVLALLSKAEMR